MIPVPERFVPRFIKRNLKFRLILIMCLITAFVLLAVFELVQMRESFRRGPRLYDLDEAITHELFDSVAIGLTRYFVDHGHYPEASGRYFFDSIKQYINIHEVYVYTDSQYTSAIVKAIRKPVGKKFDYRRIDHTYLGAGISELTIIYRRLTWNSYLLYSVGENHIDENGKGDDVVYRQ